MENNFYDLFEIDNTSLTSEIRDAYKNKIKSFNQMDDLTDEDINRIKLLKIGLYILITPNLRKIYDNRMIRAESKDMNDEPKETKTSLSSLGPQAPNEIGDSNNLDSLFEIDNSWMNKSEKSEAVNKKKNLVEGSEIGNRIFSMKNITKQSDNFSEFANNLRQPLQGREEKKEKIANK